MIPQPPSLTEGRFFCYQCRDNKRTVPLLVSHRQIEREIIKNNPGAKAEQTIRLGKNQKVRKNVVLADGKTVIIIKPNTKSGQKAAQKRFDLMKKMDISPKKYFIILMIRNICQVHLHI